MLIRSNNVSVSVLIVNFNGFAAYSVNFWLPPAQYPWCKADFGKYLVAPGKTWIHPSKNLKIISATAQIISEIFQPLSGTLHINICKYADPIWNVTHHICKHADPIWNVAHHLWKHAAPIWSVAHHIWKHADPIWSVSSGAFIFLTNCATIERSVFLF